MERIALMLESDAAIGAWYGEHLVGFARCISDRCFHAYIEDVLVDPAYQGQGIGERMLTRLINSLSGVDTLTLFCSSNLAPFYEKLGFRVFPAQTVLHRKGTLPGSA